MNTTIVDQRNFIFVAGGQGCGKERVIRKLSENLKLLPVSTGEVCRLNGDKKDPYDHLNRLVSDIQGAGDLVSSMATFEFLVGFIASNMTADHLGFVIDGFPRRIDQTDMIWKFSESLSDVNPNRFFGFHLTASKKTRRNRYMSAVENGERAGRNDNGEFDKRERIYHKDTIPTLKLAGNKGLKFMRFSVEDDGSRWGTDIATERITKLLRPDLDVRRQ